MRNGGVPFQFRSNTGCYGDFVVFAHRLLHIFAVYLIKRHKNAEFCPVRDCRFYAARHLKAIKDTKLHVGVTGGYHLCYQGPC